MDHQVPPSGFSDVDRDADPQELIRLLDLRSGFSFHQAYKQRAVALLGLHAGDRVLDVGCGTGDDVRRLVEVVGPGGWAIGVDTSTRMIAEAQMRHGQHGLPLEYRVGEVGQLAFADGSFDGCLAVRTFQHLADPRQALAEMVRVVRPGGRLVVVDPDHDMAVIDVPDRALVRKFLHFRADSIRNGGIAHHMRALFQELGVLDVSVVPMTEIHTDYAAVEATLHYEGGILIAQEAGVLTAEEADRLIRAMRTAANADRFVSAMTYFLTAGRKA